MEGINNENREYLGKKIFIFEDEDMNFNFYKMRLENLGFVVFRGETCDSVQEELQQNSDLFKGVDLFIFDYLDGQGGKFIEFLDKIKLDNPDAKLVANSGSNNDDYVKAGITSTNEKKNAKSLEEIVKGLF